MRIEVKGRRTTVDEELRQRIEKRCGKIAKQVSPLAHLEVEISEERNPSIRDSFVAEATLYLKGVTLRAREAADNLDHAVNLACEDMARQVKKHREKRRGRRTSTKVQPETA